jgi:hypothetical protein
MESFSRQEAVLGTRGRSGGQMDAFNATFGPDLQRNWDRIGVRLVGKLHVTSGTKDTFYLAPLRSYGVP